ncbi:RepA protein [Spirosoma pollinicola]|uniref:RepA protein n=1 Tax=Spirosoma pollinicola TaxID=2057025 RepID=A0A2K8ZB16_9BACT|nr:RepA protein [Spirosoma pollinicola]AUD07058.1 RepA protein [Spirosoma pollinicola]
MKYKPIKALPSFEENPFVEKAIQDVKIIKRQQIIRPKNRDEVQQIVSTDGEVTGYSSFTRFIEVDEEKFTKLYLSQFANFWELSKPAIRVFGYILTVLQPKKDDFIFDMEDCLSYTKYAQRNHVVSGLSNLIECQIIAKSNKDYKYFINPLMVFNGDRVAFTKMYVKKKKDKEKLDSNQLDLFRQETLQPSQADYKNIS